MKVLKCSVSLPYVNVSGMHAKWEKARQPILNLEFYIWN